MSNYAWMTIGKHQHQRTPEDEDKPYEEIYFGAKSKAPAGKAGPSARGGPATTRRDNVHVRFYNRVGLSKIPKDQLTPQELRKDRQVKNPQRKIHVQGVIKRIGGHIRDRSNKVVYVPPPRSKRLWHSRKSDQGAVPNNSQYSNVRYVEKPDPKPRLFKNRIRR